MPTYHNRFRGHMRLGDPRTPVSGAGGCTWPTVPPYRIMLYSRNPTGEWGFLAKEPIVLQYDLPTATHDYVVWYPLKLPTVVYRCLVEKFYLKHQEPSYRYYLTFILNAWPSNGHIV